MSHHNHAIYRMLLVPLLLSSFKLIETFIQFTHNQQTSRTDLSLR